MMRPSARRIRLSTIHRQHSSTSSSLLGAYTSLLALPSLHPQHHPHAPPTSPSTIGAKRSASAWASAVKSATATVVPPPLPPSSASPSSSTSSTPSSPGNPSPSPSPSSSNPTTSPLTPSLDPLHLVQSELAQLRTNITTLLGSGHPSLDSVAKYYFSTDGGKHVRPLVVLLMAQATNGLSEEFPRLKWLGEQRALSSSSSSSSASAGAGGGGGGVVGGGGAALGGGLDDPLTGKEVLNDYNPHMPESSSAFRHPFHLHPPTPPPPPPTLPNFPPLVAPFPPHILPTQRRLAEITEMIHVASLLHDDVVDSSPVRRGAPSAPKEYGNKLSVLGGDFLLGRASAALARLGSLEVVELLATVISNLVEGEIMQLRPLVHPAAGGGPLREETKREAWEIYLQKTYLKTASLMAKSARAGVILGGGGRLPADGEGGLGVEVKDLAYAFGRNLGIAFQLVDDMLDFTSSAQTLGKPSDGADLRLGLATAPALYAWEEHEEMGELVARRFEGEGDVRLALELIHNSSALPRTRQLAQAHIDAALDALRRLPESEAREALGRLCVQVLERSR